MPSRRRCRPGRPCGTGPSPSRTSRSRLSTCCGVAPSSSRKPRLARVLLDHAVADEAVAHARDDRRLLDLLAELHDRGEHVLAGLLAAHDLQQLHHVGRAEEVHADHVLRALRERRRSCRRRASRCWWRGSRRASSTSSSVLKTCSLTPMSSNTASMTRSASVEVVVVERRRRAAPCAASSLSCVELALLDLRLVVLADGRRRPCRAPPASSRARHRDAGVEEVHRDAAAHRAGADHGDAARSARVGVSSGTSGILLAARSAKNAWRSACDSGVVHQLEEELALELQAVVELHRRPRPRPRRRT